MYQARKTHSYVEKNDLFFSYAVISVQLNPAIAHFKGLVKIMFYIKVFTIANI